MKSVTGIALGIAAIALVAGIGIASLPEGEPEVLLVWNDLATLARGEALYEKECAGCHGSLAASQAERALFSKAHDAPPHDETGHTWQHPDYALFELTKTGEVAELCKVLDEGGMPVFGEALRDREIVDVLSYIKSTWPPEIRAEQEATNALYASQNAAVRALIASSAE
jgi:mono/diheme cytochrome c family protein